MSLVGAVVILSEHGGVSRVPGLFSYCLKTARAHKGILGLESCLQNIWNSGISSEFGLKYPGSGQTQQGEGVRANLKTPLFPSTL